MRIIDSTWVPVIDAGVATLQVAHAGRGWFDSHDLINWLNVYHNVVLNEIVANYRITGEGNPAKNPVHTATREIGKFIERELGQVKIGDHISVRNPIMLTGGGVHPGDQCMNSVWDIANTSARVPGGAQSNQSAPPPHPGFSVFDRIRAARAEAARQSTTAGPKSDAEPDATAAGGA
jgi:hypothetical protein